MIGISVYRPFHLLSTEPVVFFFSLWVAFSWAVLYLTFSSVPLVFSTNHGFNIEQNGAVFASMSVGAILSTILSIYQEKVARHYGKMSSTPEGRLYFSCIESALMPIGLFWFGWTSSPSIHWIVPTLAIGCATMGIFSIYLSVFNYLADTYHRYASSALAAQSFCRNMLGGIFPLITDPMFNHMGFPAASSLLGGIGALLTIVPWALVFFGPRIRARSKFATVSGDRALGFSSSADTRFSRGKQRKMRSIEPFIRRMFNSIEMSSPYSAAISPGLTRTWRGARKSYQWVCRACQF